MTAAALVVDAADFDGLCWRCRRARVRVFGVPCPACREILDRDYLERRAANGGRLLYLPQTGPLPMSDRNRPTAKASRMCNECARDFEYTPGIGRPPMRCPECRGHSPEEAKAPRAPRRSESKALVRTTRSNDVAVATTPEETNGAHPLNVPAFTERVLAEIDELESAIALRLRVMRTLDQYSRSINGTSGAQR